MLIQQQSPTTIGFPLVLINFIILVFNPIAPIAIVMKNLPISDIDFVLVEGYFTRSEYNYVVYSKENYICVASKEYEFKKKPKILEDLLEETLIVREKGSGTRGILEKNLEEQNLSINDFEKVIEIGNINSIKYLVKNNNGITTLYEGAVKEELENGTLQKVEVSDLQKNHNFYFV